MIKLVNISKYYTSANTVVPALRKISLELCTGEFVAVTGESGSGKSTLLNIISGYDTYDDGELYIDGEETSHYDNIDWEEYRKNRIGFVFQNYNLIDSYSVLYNVESALLIQGYDSKESKLRAKNLINQVGLGSFMRQRAGRLSSGQKQRLSIARALAKNTDILVADEPTGNLDSDNGKQIMELLKSISKDKLIIVVTHNFEEAVPYVTRKIRLHDGEVVSDTLMTKSEEDFNRKSQLEEAGEVIYEDAEVTTRDSLDNNHDDNPDSSRDRSFNSNHNSNHNRNHNRNRKSILKDNLGISRNNSSWHRISLRFSLMNITTRPRGSLTLFIFLLFGMTVSFLFLGEIFRNWDDTFAKKYNDAAFLNSDTTRIAVKKADDSVIAEEDMKRFNSIKHVELADRYGFSNDINFYIDLDIDYEYVYKSSDKLLATERLREVKFHNGDRFMKSSSCITEKDLKVGRLPVALNEIVLYSEDQNDIGKELLCYFTSKNTWGYTQYCSYTLKVVGILKEESSQVYFAEDMCNMLSLELYGDSYQMNLSYDSLRKSFKTDISIIPIVGEKLSDLATEDQINYSVRLSDDLILPTGLSAPGAAEIEVINNHDGTIGRIDEVLDATVLSEYSRHSPYFAEVSEELFYYLFQHQSGQASLFIKDYIHTDYVLKELKKLGYDAISTFRTGSAVYDEEKLAERNNIIMKSLLVIGIIGMLQIIIVFTMFHIRNKDYAVLGSMGMNYRTLKWMNLFEVYILSTASVFFVPVLLQLTGLFVRGYLPELLKYYNYKTYFIYIALSFSVIAIAIGAFNLSLKHRQKWSRYVESK